MKKAKVLEFNRTIINPFAFVGYEIIGNSQPGPTHPASRVGATRLVDYLPSRNKRELIE